MKNTTLAFCLAISASAGLAAQQTHTTTKITVEDGKEVKVTGCVSPSLTGVGFILTHVADKHGALHNYVLVSDSDLYKHVGQRLQLKGKVTDRGDAKVKVESKTKSWSEGDDRETETKTKFEGDEVALPYLAVEEWKMIAAVCP